MTLGHLTKQQQQRSLTSWSLYPGGTIHTTDNKKKYISKLQVHALGRKLVEGKENRGGRYNFKCMVRTSLTERRACLSRGVGPLARGRGVSAGAQAGGAGQGGQGAAGDWLS